jgi:hypothetical protein
VCIAQRFCVQVGFHFHGHELGLLSGNLHLRFKIRFDYRWSIGEQLMFFIAGNKTTAQFLHLGIEFVLALISLGFLINNERIAFAFDFFDNFGIMGFYFTHILPLD